MTRINVVPPKCLSDKHLMAEYRELPRIFTAIRKMYEQGKKVEDLELPDTYTLGKGHVKFFYHRLTYLICRYRELYHTLIDRGFYLDKELNASVRLSFWGCIERYNLQHLLGDYSPTPDDMYLNMARLVKRSNLDKVKEELES